MCLMFVKFGLKKEIIIVHTADGNQRVWQQTFIYLVTHYNSQIWYSKQYAEIYYNTEKS